MSFLDRLADIGKNFLADAEREFARVSTRTTFERVCQAAFLIARADGSFDASEKAMLQKVVSSKLPHFKGTDIAAAINAAEDELLFSDVAGIATLLANIGHAKGSSDAQLIMTVALAIANADGLFDEDEQKMAARIAAALGLAPAEYGL